jgi:phytoene dehydrogenase-like protein
VSSYDVIFIGGGHNGLVAATILARNGLHTLVLERSAVAGGAALTDEFYPGFRVSTLAHAAQPAPAVMSELELEKHGLELIDPDPYVFCPLPDGRALVLSREPEATARAIAQFSQRDASRFPEFQSAVKTAASFISEVMASTPPEIEHPSPADLWSMLTAARRFRRLGKKHAYRLLRWAPMPVADFVSEWFESEPLCAIAAWPGIFGTALGPRSAGSTAVWLTRVGTGWGRPQFVRGGLGGLTASLLSAARKAGVDLRVDADVARINVRDGRTGGVTLKTGETVPARVVVSNADPRRTLLDLVDPVDLEPAFLSRVRAYRSSGTVAKINLALSGLPRFTAAASADVLRGFIRIGPDLDYLERAFDASKYGAYSSSPCLDLTIPSLTDPTLAPSGAQVMSINAQFAPYNLRGTDWAAAGPSFADVVIDTLEEYAPGLKERIVHRQVITPRDLELKYGLSGGHIFHGELSLDQLFTMRPLLGWARYRTPIAGLYMCGCGTHPGNGMTGLSGWNASREILKDLRLSR